MNFRFHRKEMSRLKKKLLLYFILISVVSISVSAEIILELGSPVFSNSFNKTLKVELLKVMSEEQATDFIESKIDHAAYFHPIIDLQVRVILLLIVVGGSIVGSFFLFTKDIVEPMEGMVSATKKIAEGDLSSTVPISSKDEIGQIGSLINEMSVNLQDLILQIKSEVERLQERITIVNDKVTNTLTSTGLQASMHNKTLKMRDVRSLISTGDDVNGILKDMMIDLSALQAFVNLYKVFEVSDKDGTGKTHS